MVVFAGMSIGDREAEWVGMVLEKNTTIKTISLDTVNAAHFRCLHSLQLCVARCLRLSTARGGGNP